LCQAAPGSFSATVQPFVSKNCFACHNAKVRTAGLDLQTRRAADVSGKDRALWEKVADKVRENAMPPKGLPRPAEPQRKAFLSWLNGVFARADAALPPDPGRVTARRLNRYEYNNTVRDLLSVDFKPAADFPADDSGYGFDNIGDVLTVSPTLMEKYLAAAGEIARRAIPSSAPPKPTIERVQAPRHRADPMRFGATRRFQYEGDYEIRTGLAGQSTKVSHLLDLAVTVDGREPENYEVDTAPDHSRNFDIKLRLTPGEHTFRAVVSAREEDQPAGFRIDNFEIRGPFHPGPVPPPPSHARIFICGHKDGQHTPECARLIIADLARRAFRRPVTDAEVAGYVKFFDMARADGDPFERAMRMPLEALLVSPEFLFRIERDPRPDDPAASHRISDFELATRLSYFLWSSAPDDELFRAAQSGTLRDPKVLETEVRRMLRDPKSFALVENFGGQWLELRNLESIQPDPDRFPTFDKELRAAMLRETQLFFQSILTEDRSILDFIDAPYTFLNERLAKHYGIPGVVGPEFRRVDLFTGDHRGGVLTQASVLTVSSYPTRTSPVIRGKFILENILNAPPPPPPPNVPSLDAGGATGKLSLRQQLEEHRANAMCASCHSKMDPLGFGFENYDAIGRWRTADGGFPIDSSGTLPDGKSFNGPAELKSILKADRGAFARGLTEKLLTYALGRGLERYDKRTVDEITTKLAANDYRISVLILEIVKSMPFQMRRGEKSTT
jgi:hypothetical protein